MKSGFYRATLARRSLFTALLLASVVNGGPAVANPAAEGDQCAARYSGPLATEAQIAVEARALRLIERPEIKALMPQLREMLRQDPAARYPDGLRNIDRDLGQWTMSLAIREANADLARPEITLLVDNSPHCWFGQRMAGMAISGDNPDHIYRGAHLDGGSTYEIRGKLARGKPAQLSFEIFRGSAGETVLAKQTSATPDLGNQVSFLMLDNMQIAPDGSFVVTVGPQRADAGPNYLAMAPGPMTLAIRDVLADWYQEPSTVQIRRIAGPALTAPPTEDQMAAQFARDLPDFIKFWSGFKTNWLGGIADNTIVGPSPRTGGWGFLAGGRFNLTDDQAIVITTTDGGGGYTGFQITDPWFVMPADARSGTLSLNSRQIALNPDGGTTYVLSRKDPGVANWINTGGLLQGIIVLRWQAMPKGVDPKSLLREFKVINLANLNAAVSPETPRLDEAGRIAQVAGRKASYNARFGTPLPE